MKKGIKKIIAMVCAIAMVVSSMTVNTKIETKADVDYTGYDYKTIDASKQLYVAYMDGIDSSVALSSNLRMDGTDYIFCETMATKVVPDFQRIVYADVDEKPVAGSFFRIPLAKLTQNGYTPVTITDKNGNEHHFVVKYGNPSEATVSPVTDLNAEGGERNITVNWVYPSDATSETKYYVYLDDEQEARAILKNNDFQALLWDVPAGNHTVKVKTFCNGTFSEPVESSQVNVYENDTAITNLKAISPRAHYIDITWTQESSVRMTQLTLWDMNSGELVTTTVNAAGTPHFSFSVQSKGTYIVQLIAGGDDGRHSVLSVPVTVGIVDPVQPTDLECTVDTSRNIHVTWNVASPPEEQFYKVYLDDEFQADVPAGTFSYDIPNVAVGNHTIKVVAVADVYTTEAVTKDITIEQIIVYDTVVDQVTAGGIQQLEEPWSYEFDAGSSDSLVGVSAEGDFVARIPTYAEKAVNHVYEQITGLEVGKIYTYTYRVDTTVADNNLPVTVTAEGGYSDTYTLEQIPTEGVEVTKTFTATAETMKIDYTLGWLNNSPDIKISKAVVTKVEPVEVTGLVATGGIMSIELSWTTALTPPENQKYNIYLDGSTTPIATDVMTMNYTLSDVSVGTHSVTVKAVYNGIETTGKTVENIVVTDTPTCLTSPDVMVEGFQIKTNAPEDNVGFRTICKAPNPGSDIFVSDGFYKVKSVGVIYTLDVNNNGYRKNDILDSSYTILNPTVVSADITETKGYTYVGETLYDGAQRTYGYVATEDGIASNWNPTDDMNTYYIRTMDGMSEHGILEYSIHVRAFVIATDGTIIYGTSTASVSVAEVADYLYRNSKAQNYTGHQYLYNSILNKLTNTNPYYRTSPLSYGWDSSLFDPTPPEETTTTIHQVLG